MAPFAELGIAGYIAVVHPEAFASVADKQLDVGGNVRVTECSQRFTATGADGLFIRSPGKAQARLVHLVERAGIAFVHLEELEPVEPDAAAVITLVQHYRRALSAVGLDRPESAVVVGALR